MPRIKFHHNKYLQYMNEWDRADDMDYFGIIMGCFLILIAILNNINSSYSMMSDKDFSKILFIVGIGYILLDVIFSFIDKWKYGVYEFKWK